MSSSMSFQNLFPLVFLILVSINARAEKRALLIGIGDYPSSSGYIDLNAENDISLIHEALYRRDFTDIKAIVNEQASRQAIIHQLEQLCKRVGVGDILYIHFSGHGTQIEDDDIEEENDHLDECFVPYDGKKEDSIGKTLIRDDDLNIYLQKLRSKIGGQGQLVIVIDACHSGTGTRGNLSKSGISSVNEYIYSSLKATAEKAKNEAPIFCLFSSSAHAESKQFTDKCSTSYGALSYAVAEVLDNHKYQLSVGDWYDRVKVRVAGITSYQRPILEGDRNYLLFNNKKIESERLYEIEKYIDSDELQVSFGQLHGIYVGTKVEAISLDRNSSVIGIITRSEIHTAFVKLEESLFRNSAEVFKIRVLEKAPPPIQLGLQIDIPKNTLWSAVINDLKTKKVVDENASPELFLKFGGNQDTLILSTKEHLELDSWTYNQRKEIYHAESIAQAIRDYTQGKVLKNYEFNSHQLGLSLELIPINPQYDIQGKITGEKMPRPSIAYFLDKQDGTFRFVEGDVVKLKVSNKGMTPAYFSIIDITPENKIQTLVPHPDDDYIAEEYRLEPKQSMEINHYYPIRPPYGTDMIKLIAANKPITANIRGMAKNFGEQSNDEAHPFENLISYILNMDNSRSEEEAFIAPNELEVSSMTYRVVKNR